MKKKIKNVCMFVLNPCINDARVLKEADTLGKAGYDVKIVAIVSNGTNGLIEKKKNFTIYRIQPRSVFIYSKKVFELIHPRLAAKKVFELIHPRLAAKEVFELILPRLLQFHLRKFLNGNYWNRKTNSKNVKDPKGTMRFLVNWRNFFTNSVLAVMLNLYRNSTLILYCLKAIKISENFKADVYHAHDLNTLLPAYWAAKKTNAKIVYDTHELFTEIHVWDKVEKYIFTKMEAFLIKRVDKIITVNNSISNELVKRYKVNQPSLILNCPPPINSEEMLASDDLLRQATGISSDKKLILYQGGFSSNRGLAELIKAFLSLDEKYCLVFMGYGRLQSKLEAIVKENELNNRVKFIPAVSQEKLLKYTSSAELGVIPYKPVSLNNYYTLPNKLFEYINANIPIVASDLPELRGVIKDFDIGCLFNPAESKSIANAIKYVLSDKNRYLTMKENTIKAAKKYNWDIESRKLLQYYNSL